MQDKIIDRFNDEVAWESILGKPLKAGQTQTYYECPSCGGKLGSNGIGKLTIHKKETPQRIIEHAHCFSCGFYEDRFGTWKFINGYTSYSEAIKEAKAYLAMKSFEPEQPEPQTIVTTGLITDFTPYFEWCRTNLYNGRNDNALDYIKGRGITVPTVKRVGGGFDYHCDSNKNPGGIHHIEGQYWGKRIIWPTAKNHFLARDVSGKAKLKVANPTGYEVHIFGEDLFFTPENKGSTVFVVEGDFDMLSFLEIGAQAVATNSKQNGRRLYETLVRMKPEVKLIFVPDNDSKESERRNTEQKFREMQYNAKNLGIPSYFCRLCADTPYKDANDFLRKDKEEFTSRVQGALRNATARQ